MICGKCGNYYSEGSVCKVCEAEEKNLTEESKVLYENTQGFFDETTIMVSDGTNMLDSKSKKQTKVLLKQRKRQEIKEARAIKKIDKANKKLERKQNKVSKKSHDKKNKESGKDKNELNTVAKAISVTTGKKKVSVWVKLIVWLLIIILLVCGFMVYKVSKWIKKHETYWSTLPKTDILFNDDNNIYDCNGQIIFNDYATLKYISQDRKHALFEDETTIKIFSYGEKNIEISRPNIYVYSNNLEGLAYISEHDNLFDLIYVSREYEKKVISDMNNIDNLVISNDGKYTAFINSWTYDFWREDSSLENGGETVVKTVHDIYLGNKYGENTKIYSTEDDIQILGVKNDGKVVLNNTTETKSVIVSKTGDEELGKLAKTVLFQGDAVIVLAINGDLDYIHKETSAENVFKINSQGIKDYLIATGVQDLFGIYGFGFERTVFQVNNVIDSKSEDKSIIYVKGDCTYIKDYESYEESFPLMNKYIDINCIKYYVNDTLIYKDEELSLSLKKHNSEWYENEDLNEDIYNACGKGYISIKTVNEQKIMVYNYSPLRLELDTCDKVLKLCGDWVFYTLDNVTYAQNVYTKEKKELFDSEKEIAVYYSR